MQFEQCLACVCWGDWRFAEASFDENSPPDQFFLEQLHEKTKQTGGVLVTRCSWAFLLDPLLWSLHIFTLWDSHGELTYCRDETNSYMHFGCLLHTYSFQNHPFFVRKMSWASEENRWNASGPTVARRYWKAASSYWWWDPVSSFPSFADWLDTLEKKHHTGCIICIGVMRYVFFGFKISIWWIARSWLLWELAM